MAGIDIDRIDRLKMIMDNPTSTGVYTSDFLGVEIMMALTSGYSIENFELERLYTLPDALKVHIYSLHGMKDASVFDNMSYKNLEYLLSCYREKDVPLNLSHLNAHQYMRLARLFPFITIWPEPASISFNPKHINELLLIEENYRNERY